MAGSNDYIYQKLETSSPTIQLESLIMTLVVDAKEGRDVMTADAPKAFMQTTLPDNGE